MPTGYRTITEIGRGGFCVVHKCEADDSQPVALKSLIDPAGASADVFARFQREARLMDDVLAHPNIVAIIHRNLSGADPYFVMEIADTNLRAMIREGAWKDEDWVIDVFRQMLGAMAYAHDKGVIHRDLKPENALIYDGVVKVSDFGLGKHLVDDGTVGLTRTNQWSGTEPYMAPEQFTAMKETGPEADVFALGKIMSELLTGEIPMVGLPDVSPLPERFKYFVSRCCAMKAENRYADGREALDAFNRILSPSTAQSPTEMLAALEEKWFNTEDGPDLEVVREIDELLRTNADDERMFSSRVPRLPEDLLDQYMDKLPDEFAHMLAVYDDHVSGGLPFEYCDVVTDFYERIFRRSQDPRLKELVIRRLFEMGAYHDRFHTRTRLLTLLADHTDPGTIEIAERTIRTGSARERRFFHERAASFDLPQSLRQALAGSGRTGL
jgi:serine/threonine protein kinase